MILNGIALSNIVSSMKINNKGCNRKSSLDFLHSKLKLAPNTISSSFLTLNTNCQNMEGQKLQSLNPRLTIAL